MNNRTSRFFKAAAAICAAAGAVSFVMFQDDYAVGILWCLATISLFYMHFVAKEDKEFDK